MHAKTIVAWTFGPGRTFAGPGPGSDPVPNWKWAIFVWGPSDKVGPAKVRDRGRTRFRIENQEVRATMAKTLLGSCHVCETMLAYTVILQLQPECTEGDSLF